MYKEFEISIVTIILEEVYADGVIEAYEREALKKVLKKVGIQRELFQQIHKQISIQAKKQTLQPALNNPENFLFRVSKRLSQDTNSTIAQEITTLLAKEFQLELPTSIQEPLKPKEIIYSSDHIVQTKHSKSPDLEIDKPKNSIQIKQDKPDQINKTKVYKKPNTNNFSSSFTPSSANQQSIPKKTIATKKLVATSQDNLKISSKNYGLACYLLGKGSLSWMIVFALIPILINLNVQELYTQHHYLSKTVTPVQGTTIGSMYARNSFMGSEIVEVHYHYTKDGKNFTGYSYTLDNYIKEGLKVSVLVNINNPKLSRLKDGSYYEYDIVIFIPLLAFLLFLLAALYGTFNSGNTPYTELKMIGSDLNSILSHFCIRRLSILLVSILFCSLFSVGELFFNTLLPIFNTIIIFAIVVFSIIGLAANEN